MISMRTIAAAALATVSFAAIAVAQDKEPYRIGVSEPTSGAASVLGVPVVESMKLAAKTINDAGGVDGHPIELVIRDDQSKPDVAVQNFRRLIEEGVYGIIGPNQGSNTLAVQQIAKQAEMPFCAFNNTLSITKLGNPYVFRCQSTDSDNIRAAFLFLKNDLHVTKIGVLYTSDAYGSDAAGAMPDVAKDVGITITDMEKIAYGGADTTAEWTKMLATKPEAVLMWGAGSVMSVALRNGQQLGNTLPVIGSQGSAAPDIIAAAGSSAEGLYLLSLNAPDQVSPEQKILSDNLKAAHGQDAQLYSYNMIGWDAVYVFAKALEIAKGDKSKIKDALEQIRGLKLASGNYIFEPDNHDGLRSDSFWVVQVKDGQMRGIKHGF